MFARVRGTEIKSALTNIINGDTLVSITFCRDELKFKTSGTIMVYSSCAVEDSDITGEVVKTFMLDNTIDLLLSKQDVELILTGGILTIKQGLLSYVLTEKPDEVIALDFSNIEFSKRLSVSKLTNICNAGRAFDNISKLLLVSSAPIQFYNGYAYIYYSNTMYREAIDICDMSISQEALRKAIKVMSKYDSVLYNVDLDKGMLIIKCSETDFIVLTVQKVNRPLIGNLESVISKVKHVSDINMGRYLVIIDTLCKVYKKNTVSLSVCQNDINMFLDRNTNKFDIGGNGVPLVSMQVSTPQLATIAKLFSDKSIIVSKGESCLCLQSKLEDKVLLMSGLLY